MQVKVSICPIKKTCVSFVSFKQHLPVSGLEEISNKIYQSMAHLQYTNILTWLRGLLVIFLYLVWFSFFVLKTLLGIARQRSHEKIAILSLNPQSHDRTLVYQMWVFHHTSIIITAFIHPNQPTYARVKQSHVVSKVRVFWPQDIMLKMTTWVPHIPQ